MEQELEQIVRAIIVASDPTQGSIHHQALEFLSTIEQNSDSTWRLALALFVDQTPEGVRKYPPQVRFFALRLLEDFFDNRFEPLDNDTFRSIQQALLSYIQSEYVYGSAETNAQFLRNKFSHTLTLFFLCTYNEQWSTFFVDLFSLIRPAESSSTYNQHVSLLFFHLVLEISGEVADQMIKSARQYSAARHARDARVRDAVRERDASRINEAVLAIVSNAVDRMNQLRKIDGQQDPELDSVEEVVDWGIRTFGSYVGWIDINLTVTATTVPLLFSLLSDPTLPIRLATSAALHRIVAKGLKEPADKLKLIKVLSLGPVIDALEIETRKQQNSRGSDIDEGEESYRETLGKLLNVLGLELSKLVEDCSFEDVCLEAKNLLNQTLPIMLRFMEDEYDDTCSTVFPLLSNILGNYKRDRKVSSDSIDDSRRSFLTSLLQVLLTKMKWDEEVDLEEIDEEDKYAFEVLRKELRSFMDAILIIEPDLVTDAVRNLALNQLQAYQRISLKWNDAELAIYLVYIFGEINKSGKGRAAFCQAPTISKEKRKETDYTEYPLTSHGEMLLALVQSGISAYPNRAVSMQYFETVARYCDFFKVRKDCIMPALEAMVDSRGLHNNDSSVRSRVYYLFSRFIRECRNEISVDLAGKLIEVVRDVLPIEIELPELENPEQDDLLTEAANMSTLFNSQLYLFEVVGTLISLFFKNPQQQSSLLLSVVEPMLEDLSAGLLATKSVLDVVPILRVHHTIMALGNIAKGFPDFPSPVPANYIPPPLEVFGQVAQAVLVSLKAMNMFKVVRDATRFAFARILAITGPNVTHFIPPLMANLLTQFEPSELVDFMNFIALLVYKLQKDMFNVLDELIGPLTTHITGVLSQPVSGTDDVVAHADIKKTYLSLLNNVMVSKLQDIFLSERNKGSFEGLLETMQRLAEDLSDPMSARAAFVFLTRCVNVWCQPEAALLTNGDQQNETHGLPGFERFVYERIVPTAFRVVSLPSFNLKDGQILLVLHEIANLLQTVCRIRGAEAYEFFLSVFLPSQNWPPDTAIEFTTKLRDLDSKGFRKYFTDFVRVSRSSS